MKTFSQRQALLIATAASGVALVATFGFAWIMRTTTKFSMRLPNIPTSAQAAMVTQNLTADAAQGRHLFLMNCAHCHGDDARGDEGPDLHDLHKSDERIHQLITAGVKGEMPSFARKLNDSDIRALTAYLRTLHS
jgi:mono/diheme cytochrome c family protein